jgi:hypothetical protein
MIVLGQDLFGKLNNLPLYPIEEIYHKHKKALTNIIQIIDKNNDQKQSQCVFRRLNSGLWEFTYNKQTDNDRNLIGFHYIEILLKHVGYELHVLDMVNLVQGRTYNEITKIYSTIPKDTLEKIGLNLEISLDDPIPIIDKGARQSIRLGIENIQGKLESENFASPDEKVMLQDELNILTKYISAATRLDGRDRCDNSSVDKARKNISGCIRRAITKISKYNEPLYFHLKSSIKTGIYCSYIPDKIIEWE